MLGYMYIVCLPVTLDGTVLVNVTLKALVGLNIKQTLIIKIKCYNRLNIIFFQRKKRISTVKLTKIKYRVFLPSTPHFHWVVSSQKIKTPNMRIFQTLSELAVYTFRITPQNLGKHSLLCQKVSQFAAGRQTSEFFEQQAVMVTPHSRSFSFVRFASTLSTGLSSSSPSDLVAREYA